ncbi:hypothetical protein [Bacillus sp. FJAT-45350]|uniref:hypothetical protein n=1 Tax=Bacillus sp. FJAT-45350 TaxID=2011014 RepID=UPI000BB83740|nr:hypothetical protein [Bacillus sp. FJAT-45350]
MKKDNIIPFPQRKVKLYEDEYIEFQSHMEKMKQARTLAEVNYYYSLAKSVIEKAKNRNI